MSKTTNCIQLLKILYSRNSLVNVAELANLLETNKRNILEYVKELRCAGYQIKSVSGRYGGYFLEYRDLFPTINLTEEEKEGLIFGYEYLLARNDFLKKDCYGKAMWKISPMLTNKNVTIGDTFIANRFPLTMSQQELQDRYLTITKCIDKKLALKIEYCGLENIVENKIINPYKLFMYNNAWYVLALDESLREIRYFKLNIIEKYALTEKTFRILSSYNESDYLDDFGMKQNGEWYSIKIKLSGRYAVLAKERVYGKEQVVQILPDKTTILSCKMQNKQDVVKFVLGFGENCTILEPQWLKEEILKVIENIKSFYMKNR